jgi:hypothetical protein
MGLMVKTRRFNVFWPLPQLMCRTRDMRLCNLQSDLRGSNVSLRCSSADRRLSLSEHREFG